MPSPPFLLFFYVYMGLPKNRTGLIVIGAIIGLWALLEETGMGRKIWLKWRVANSKPKIPEGS